MKLIVGLGNPWKEYEKTRHNVGFMFLDYFREKNNFEDWKQEKKFKAQISIWEYKNEKIILLKPETYMNLSGEALEKVLSFYKIEKKDIIVVHDDVSMDFLKLRHRNKWSAWWHNWIKSIISKVWDDFNRIKIWIWYDIKYELPSWVLWKFSQDEIMSMFDVFGEVQNLLDDLL